MWRTSNRSIGGFGSRGARKKAGEGAGTTSRENFRIDFHQVENILYANICFNYW
jgi:hypothetical protein